MDIQVGQIWRHKKRDSIYEIVSTTASMQCASDPHLESYEDEDWIAYKPYGAGSGGILYFRLKEEFLDGRFSFLKDAE
jgi:hypothetical protein